MVLDPTFNSMHTTGQGIDEWADEGPAGPDFDFGEAAFIS